MWRLGACFQRLFGLLFSLLICCLLVSYKCLSLRFSEGLSLRVLLRSGLGLLSLRWSCTRGGVLGHRGGSGLLLLSLLCLLRCINGLSLLLGIGSDLRLRLLLGDGVGLRLGLSKCILLNGGLLLSRSVHLLLVRDLSLGLGLLLRLCVAAGTR